MSSPHCSICHNIFAEGETIAATVCGHVYHNDCLCKWIKTSATCPKCREICQSTQRIHIDFINDDELACAQARNSNEELIKTLMDTIESLILDKRKAENSLLEMKMLVQKNKITGAIDSEISNPLKFKTTFTNPFQVSLQKDHQRALAAPADFELHKKPIFRFDSSSNETIETSTSLTRTLSPSPSTRVPFLCKSTVLSKDVTDKNSTNLGQFPKILENNLLKSTFLFGQNVQKITANDDSPKVNKQANTELTNGSALNKTLSTSTASATSSVFKQLQTTNDIFTSVTSKPVTATTKILAAPSSSFLFGADKVPPAAPRVLRFKTPTEKSSQHTILGSSSMSTFAGSRSNSGCSSSGNSSTLSPLSNEGQSQATLSPAFSLFKPNNTSTKVSPSNGNQSRVDGFNFSLNEALTFNFSEQNPQQMNVPFQFGSSSDVPNIFISQPRTTNTTSKSSAVTQ